MSEHYYTEHPTVAHERREISFSLGRVDLQLVTDAGVFSKQGVDIGTMLLLKSVEPPSSGIILDLGCGYGPVGLYLASLAPDCEVHMTDINERAVSLAQENAVRNGITNVRFHHGDGFTPLVGVNFDFIVTNPPIRAGKEKVLGLFQKALEHLQPAGRLAFVVRTKQGAKTLAREVEAQYASVEEVAKGSGYRVFVAYKQG